MAEQFELDPVNSALLMMDFQNFIVENHVPEPDRAEVLANAAAIAMAARTAGMPVIHVMVAFRSGHPEISDRNRPFSAAKKLDLFVLGAESTAIHQHVTPAGDEPVVIKHRISAFSETDLATLLRSKGVNTLVMAGITTSGVVLSTVRSAFDLDYRIVVAGDACADPDPALHLVLLERVIAHHAEVVSSNKIVEMLSV